VGFNLGWELALVPIGIRIGIRTVDLGPLVLGHATAHPRNYKNSLNPRRPLLRCMTFEPKTSCLSHRFLTNSIAHHICQNPERSPFEFTRGGPLVPGGRPLARVGDTNRDYKVTL
jgi:hypothetical protein